MYGDAIIETSTNGTQNSKTAWNGNLSVFVYGTEPFCVRGGNYMGTTGAGIFTFQHTEGNMRPGTGFRAVICPK